MLVIDDVAANRALIVDTLVRYGFRVSESGDSSCLEVENVPEPPMEAWVNFYRDGSAFLYDSKAEAETDGKLGGAISRVRVTALPGQFDSPLAVQQEGQGG